MRGNQQGYRWICPGKGRLRLLDFSTRQLFTKKGDNVRNGVVERDHGADGGNEMTRNRNRARAIVLSRGLFVGVNPEPVVEIVRVAVAMNDRVSVAVFELYEMGKRARRKMKTHFL
jgi:hypothetical protein